MKKVFIIIIILIAILLFFLLRSCDKEHTNREAIIPAFKKNEMIVVYKNAPTSEATRNIKEAISTQIDTSGLSIRKCSECDGFVELWKADSIHTVIHGEGVKSGSGGGGSKTVGEDAIAFYSVNFTSELPMEFSTLNNDYIIKHQQDRALYVPTVNPAGKDTITIAVLDTGLDTLHLNNRTYLWTNQKDKEDGKKCYEKNTHGWNFISNNSNIYDDNNNLHGTVVTHYIINEFAASPKNYVQIMSLKTHDNNGNGDLFSSICAIHFAMKKGANIINASWGFYSFDTQPLPYLDSLITKVLKDKGILFVTAAGNKIPEADSLASVYYKNKFGNDLPSDSLRNLNINRFYPAILSTKDNNVITATTSYEDQISPTQNFSSRYVDLGVKADQVVPGFMKFKLPFPGNTDFTSGSSFAAAITSGKIGAFLPKTEFKPGIMKQEVMDTLSNIHIPLGISPFIFKNQLLEDKKLIRKGSFTMP